MMMTAASWAGGISAILLVVSLGLLIGWLRGGRDDGRHVASDPCDGAHRELLINDDVGQLTPEQAAAYIALLEEEPEPMVEVCCPLCIIAMCDEWGVPLEMVRTVGAREYCRDHKHSILARARQGA